MDRRPVRWLERPAAEAALLGVVLFALYAAGACPTIYVGDSGELVAAVHLLGIPHPTGYPLYVLLGKVWTLLVPLGSIAYRMSLFSAACGAAACAVLYALCRRIGLQRLAALLAAFLLAFAPSFWGEANVQRVYTLNALFVALATAAACTWRSRRDLRWLVLAFFACALGAANHTFMGIYAVGLAAYALVVQPSIVRRPLALAAIAAVTVVGLLPYAYLPLRSRADPRLDWGNPESLDGFLDVVLRRDFWHRAWIEQPSDALTIGADYLHGLHTELAWVGLALAAVGAAGGWRRRWPVGLPLSIMALNVTALALHGSRSDIFIWHRYYIPSYAMAAVLAGMGAQVVLERVPAMLRAGVLVIPVVMLAGGWRTFDRSRYRIAEDFSLAVLHALPPGANLIATDDNILFVLIYLHLVEQQRPDINLILQGVGEADLPPLRFNPDSDPLFFTHHPNWSIKGLDIVPVGVVFRAWRAERPRPTVAIDKWQLDGESDARVPQDYLTNNLVGHFHYMLGSTLEEHDWPRARREYALAATASPENDVLFYNLGLIYGRAGLIAEALAAFERSRVINPRHIANVKRPRAADRVDETRAELERLTAIERQLAADATLQVLTTNTRAYYLRLAELLEQRGEPVAARGHRLRAAESAARSEGRL